MMIFGNKSLFKTNKTILRINLILKKKKLIIINVLILKNNKGMLLKKNYLYNR
jgi:hypothetical protein